MTQTQWRAAIIEQPAAARFTLTTVQCSELRPGEVLVEVKAAGLCRSDWHIAAHDNGTPNPALLGHELAGVVSAVGPGVTEFSVGDHVVGCGMPSCGVCEKCLSGERIWCLHPERSRRDASDTARLSTADGRPLWHFMGIGSFAERTIVHESVLVAVDRRVPFDKAAVLGCAVATGAGAVMRSAKTQPRETVAVIGAGGIGLNAIQAAALVGARKIIAVDVTDEKLELARRFGATHTVNSLTSDAVAAVREITSGQGVDHSFEMTGIPKLLRHAYDMLARNGTAYIVGMQPPTSTFELPTSGYDLGLGASVQGVLMGSTNFKIDVPYYAELYLQGRFNLDDLVADHIKLEQINEGYERLLSGDSVARSVIVFD